MKAPNEESRAVSRLFVVGESDDASANERLSKVSCQRFVISDPMRLNRAATSLPDAVA